MRVRARFRGALLGVVVGDALGARLEGHPGPVPADRLARVEQDDSELAYTDDTAMTFGLADSLLFCGRLELDHLAQTFAVAYQREPRRGYGAGAAELLRRLAGGASWAELSAAQFGGQGSFGNGAAMRVAPVALHAGGDPEEAYRLGTASATVTHAHQHAVDAAGVQATAVARALRQHGREQPGEWLAAIAQSARTSELRTAIETIAALDHSSSPAAVAATTGTGVAALEAVPASLAAVALNWGSFPGTIRFAIAMGGDTDTIAAMAGAIAGARLGEDAVPPAWSDRAEGTERARGLADRFSARATWRDRS